MTASRRDLGTRGRVIVAATAVGAVGVLGGWMAATDHSATTSSTDASSSAGSSTGSSTGSSSSAGTSAGSSQQRDDGTAGATPGLPTQQLTPDARTGGS